ncbi:MAG: Hsp20/alpha crystallin family protein [SAR202 cluster bacterium]|nr:Hsp20/alpha crystallin family protein [SAR202 cluster bacterium]
MASLTRWDPMAELASMRSVMDRLFDSRSSRLAAPRDGEDFESGALNLDVVENGNEFIVKAALPGIDPKDVDIAVEDDVLTIKGESRQEEETADQHYLRRELRYGSVQRQLRLPPAVDAERAEARFEHGILKLTLPKRPEARSRSFKIQPRDAIEGESTGQAGNQ